MYRSYFRSHLYMLRSSTVSTIAGLTPQSCLHSRWRCSALPSDSVINNFKIRGHQGESRFSLTSSGPMSILVLVIMMLLDHVSDPADPYLGGGRSGSDSTRCLTMGCLEVAALSRVGHASFAPQEQSLACLIYFVFHVVIMFPSRISFVHPLQEFPEYFGFFLRGVHNPSWAL